MSQFSNQLSEKIKSKINEWIVEEITLDIDYGPEEVLIHKSEIDNLTKCEVYDERNKLIFDNRKIYPKRVLSEESWKEIYALKEKQDRIIFQEKRTIINSVKDYPKKWRISTITEGVEIKVLVHDSAIIEYNKNGGFRFIWKKRCAFREHQFTKREWEEIEWWEEDKKLNVKNEENINFEIIEQMDIK